MIITGKIGTIPYGALRVARCRKSPKVGDRILVRPALEHGAKWIPVRVDRVIDRYYLLSYAD
jgi:hypothetical protein